MTRYAYRCGAFCIDAIPNQPQVAHCHSFFIHAHMRSQGLAKRLKQNQMQALKTQGYNYATCTTAGDNARQHKVLENCGWKRLSEFANSLTGGTTVLWGWVVA